MSAARTEQSPDVTDQIHAEDVTALIDSSAWPSLTLLLDTTPADRMTSRDAERLDGLVVEVMTQMEDLRVASTELIDLLRRAVLDARRRSTSRGLVICVSQAVQRTFRLPQPVRPRVAVEPTFATRDVLHALHRTPPHLLLLLEGMGAQLYRGFADTLVPVAGSAFPLQHRLPALGALQAGDEQLEDFLAQVDRELGRVREHVPAPLVVAGAPGSVAALLRRGRNLERLAGVLTGADVRSPEKLYAAAHASIAEYLRSREEEALLALEDAFGSSPESVRSGIDACWDAAEHGSPRFLLVEEGFQCPAVVTASGPRRIDALRVRVPEAGDVRHDLVDDLIEIVIRRGGWVAFARNGALAAHHRVCLVTRTVS